jgi:hypothetical protein
MLYDERVIRECLFAGRYKILLTQVTISINSFKVNASDTIFDHYTIIDFEYWSR